MVMGYDPDRDIVIVTGSNNGAFRLGYLNCANPAAGWTMPTLSSVPVIKAGWQSPLSYVPEIGKWIMLVADARGNVPARGNHGPGGDDGSVVGEFPSVWGNSRPCPRAYVAGKRWSYAPQSSRSSGNPAAPVRPMPTAPSAYDQDRRLSR